MTDAPMPLAGFDAAPSYRAAHAVSSSATPAVELARGRLAVVALAFVLAFGAVGAKLVDATILTQGRDPTIAAPPAAEAAAAAAAHDRGDIVDRNGVLLATSLETQSVFADPKVVLDPAAAAAKLAAVLPDLNYAETLRRLKSNKRFVWIRRNLTPKQYYEVNALGLPGVYFQREARRVYPQGRLAAHVVGYTGVDNTGLAGIEREFDKQLSAGHPVQLSLDIRLQHLMEQAITGGIQEFQAVGGGGLIMDVRTGEVLAMVSLPDFDPDQPGDGDPINRFNRMSLGVYEMGSTFKILNTAMALDSGKVTLNDVFDANPIHIGRFTIHDFETMKHPLSVAEIFKYSSNIGSAHMAIQAGVDTQQAFMAKLGMLKPSPIELPEVGRPEIPHPWRDINAMTIAFGHGMAVSPVQLCSGAAAIIDGGILHQATILKRPAGELTPGVRVISPQTSDVMRRLMRLVVTAGTGEAADVPGYLVGGKTGTADKTSGHGYAQHQVLASFLGAFPMNDPRYIVYGMLDSPQATKATHGFHTGGWTVAPLVEQVIAQMGPLMGVRPVDDKSPAILQAMAIDDRPKGGKVASN